MQLVLGISSGFGPLPFAFPCSPASQKQLVPGPWFNTIEHTVASKCDLFFFSAFAVLCLEPFHPMFTKVSLTLSWPVAVAWVTEVTATPPCSVAVAWVVPAACAMSAQLSAGIISELTEQRLLEAQVSNGIA